MRSSISNFQSFPRRAFSLVEVLLAIFILGIGLIMVASVFPVGANWTRQTAETSIGQNIAQNALTVIKSHYGPNGDLRSYLAPDYLISPGNVNTTNPNLVLKQVPSVMYPFMSPFTLQALPGFTNISPLERAYLFGSSTPFPVQPGPPGQLDANFRSCTYFWTPLIRLSPIHRGGNASTNGIIPTSSYNYDLFILVFRKGAINNTFSSSPPMPPGFSMLEVPGTRNSLDTTFTEALIPSVGYTAWSAGQHDPGHTPTVFNSLPAMGQYGIGAQSGTVFRQVLDPTVALGAVGSNGAVPRPPISTIPTVEPVIYCPAADGANNSVTPLIYIYQTTLTF